jgi:hypothetical protein
MLYVVYEHEMALNLNSQTPEEKDDKVKRLYEAFKVCDYSFLSSSLRHILQSS